jgi:hypothetical protein
MRSRSLVAALAVAPPEAHGDLVADALVRARPALERLKPELASKGHGWGIFVTDADQVDLEGASAETIAKHAALAPGAPWVELLPLNQLLMMIGDEDGGDAFAGAVERLRRAARKPLPAGMVWIVVAVGGTLAAFPAKPGDARVPR